MSIVPPTTGDPRVGATTSAPQTDYGAAFRRYATIAGVHLAVVAIWYAITATGYLKPFILPSPLATLETLFHPRYRWLDNAAVTATEIFVGYWLAVVAGVMLALLFSWFRTVHAIFFPLLVTISMVPKVALGPLFVVWFGYGITTNIFFAFIISFFPILITTARGLREVEPDLLDLVRALKGTRWQIFTKIQFPGALPYIFSAMKVGAILAVAGAIVGEFIASSSGLGYLMIQVQTTLDTAAMFMAVILLTLLGISLFGFVLLLERIFVVKDARLDANPS
ncbi:MAG: ABC transporter permease [Alphaproteobacteria bacterium]|nr:ABC transporter permease [Alphaproteobacteria bacterium]MBU0797491.1 ABC transporter permease [Alphaproteobacteria bacterium]MBU0889080.1 ABC transporter permease [Alphaproteobacteria bacterium]MBU1813264.1 ABC transporter permease [Alphaproteobacteria bacterium]MBU2092237.1 ABC transporter permease [Alphaproteobacteria bacterium]